MMNGNMQYEETILREEEQSNLAVADHTHGETFWNQLAEQTSRCTFCRGGTFNEAVWEVLIKTLPLLIKALQLGRLRGVVAIMLHNCNEPKIDSQYWRLIQDLIQRDILIAVPSCMEMDINQRGEKGFDALEQAGLGLAEFCSNLNIPPVLEMGNKKNQTHFLELCRLLANHIETVDKVVPMAVISQENRQETVEFNLYTIEGAGICTPETDSTRIADLVDEYIHGQRLHMGWRDRYHCSKFS